MTGCWEIAPAHLTHLLPRSQSTVEGNNIPSEAPLEVRVEEKEKPLMLHVDYGPLSAGSSRPRIQQVLSGWTSGTAGWGGQV